ncbi:uncharacterized protein SCHCODRAFT_02241776 [Schizophyllum commune H4-8]|uniref:uncharacterized protein n=1 Tax=Schizophyllum commune (strain H4-8 / FGSC 9210) TaxID=578458 RepID=UPI00215E358E|nr:uncharacterized protein SCHCODRAFT_02241776 [Schizophyllum commune H4-8]KAI5895879.1 hypothetical protein SCHCODRAFT_02241776 [Schizophyllum commune H4-8]
MIHREVWTLSSFLYLFALQALDGLHDTQSLAGRFCPRWLQEGPLPSASLHNCILLLPSIPDLHCRHSNNDAAVFLKMYLFPVSSLSMTEVMTIFLRPISVLGTGELVKERQILTELSALHRRW